ncbi:MAG: lipase [Lachnospira sp.]|nr:lipase [Lachnospira sp.]
MKHSNFFTFLSFIMLIVIIILFMSFNKQFSPNSVVDAANNRTQNNTMATTSASNLDKTEYHTTKSDSIGEKPKETTDLLLTETIAETITISMKDSLFIGDSRTVGLSEYACIDDADFFSDVGMSVYNIYQKTISVPAVGKVTLHELLTHKTYHKIYIMLGINEMGYDFDNIVVHYKKLVEFIKEKQPEATLFIQANLHVTKVRSNSDKVINNHNINQLNTALSKIADNTKIFYLDVNFMFDDENGHLSSDKSNDNTHLYAKYYAEWGKWIINQTAARIGEG